MALAMSEVSFSIIITNCEEFLKMLGPQMLNYIDSGPQMLNYIDSGPQMLNYIDGGPQM